MGLANGSSNSGHNKSGRHSKKTPIYEVKKWAIEVEFKEKFVTLTINTHK